MQLEKLLMSSSVAKLQTLWSLRIVAQLQLTLVRATALLNLFDDPLGIVEFDEVADGVPQLRDVAVDATMDDLFLQRAIEPLGDAVGLGLGDEGVYPRSSNAVS